MRLLSSVLSAALAVSLMTSAAPVYAVSDNHTESVTFADSLTYRKCAR